MCLKRDVGFVICYKCLYIFVISAHFCKYCFFLAGFGWTDVGGKKWYERHLRIKTSFIDKYVFSLLFEGSKSPGELQVPPPPDSGPAGQAVPNFGQQAC